MSVCNTVYVCLLSLGPLVSKVKEYQVETIVDTLCTNMLSDKEQLRDISSIGLKTVIGELPPASSGKDTASTQILLQVLQMVPLTATGELSLSQALLLQPACARRSLVV